MFNSKVSAFKLFALILTIFTLVACGSKNDGNKKDKDNKHQLESGVCRDIGQDNSASLKCIQLSYFTLMDKYSVSLNNSQCQLHKFNGDVKSFVMQDESYYSDYNGNRQYNANDAYMLPSELGVTSQDELYSSYINCTVNGVDYYSWGAYDEDSSVSRTIFSFYGKTRADTINSIIFRAGSNTNNNGIHAGCKIVDENSKEIAPTQTLQPGSVYYTFNNINLHYGDKVIIQCDNGLQVKTYAKEDIE